MIKNESSQPAAGAGSASPLAGRAASRAATLQRLSRLKSRIVVTTLLGFGALSVLVAGHRVGATAATTTPPAAATPAPSTDNGGGFYNQGNGQDDNGGNGGFFSGGGSGGQGGYGFGNGGYAQPPVAGSGAS